MANTNYLILGGGIAGTTAAEDIRTKDPQGSITILTEEGDRLYSRVMLPHYLRNEDSFEQLFLRKPEGYSEKQINLVTNTRVAKVDPANKKVTTTTGKDFPYEKLLIATGGKVNRLDNPGANLPEVMYLRTLADAKKIKEQINKSKEGVVIGGGFIGIEFAQSFVKNNLKTSAIVREEFFWGEVVGKNSGELLSQILKENSVELITGGEVDEFVGEEKLEKVHLKSGKELTADIAGVGIGIHLELDYLKDSGLVMKKGVVVNEFLETSIKDIWAAGDVAEFYDPVFNRYHVLGNWANASAQGRAVGANMTGAREPYQTASMYSINIFGGNLSFLGDTEADSSTEIIERGNVAEKKIARIFLREDRIVGASLINLPIERAFLSNLIKNRTKVTVAKEKLSDLTFSLDKLLT